MNWDSSTAFDMSDRSQFPAVPAGGTGLRDALLNPSATPDREVSMIPVQMHWHVTSEHSWQGMLVRPLLRAVVSGEHSAVPPLATVLRSTPTSLLYCITFGYVKSLWVRCSCLPMCGLASQSSPIPCLQWRVVYVPIFCAYPS